MKNLFLMYMKGLTARGETQCRGEDWSAFEELIRINLKRLGHQFNEEIIYKGDHYQAMEQADFVIYAHKRRQEISADLFYKQMHLNKLFTIDHEGWGYDHSQMRSQPDFEKVDLEKAISFCEKRRQLFLSSGESKFAQAPRSKNLNLPDSYFFFPLQRPNDETIRFHAPMPEVDILHLVAKWGQRRKKHIVFKLHPYNIFDPEILDAVKQIEEGNDYVHLLEGNIHDFIDRSKGVIVINSGVGFESLIHGKPVITFGDSDYKWVTLNVNENNLDEIVDYACNYSMEQRNQAWQFIYHYFFNHAYSIEAEYIEASKERLFTYLSKAINVSKSVSGL